MTGCRSVDEHSWRRVLQFISSHFSFRGPFVLYVAPHSFIILHHSVIPSVATLVQACIKQHSFDDPSFFRSNKTHQPQHHKHNQAQKRAEQHTQTIPSKNGGDHTKPVAADEQRQQRVGIRAIPPSEHLPKCAKEGPRES